MLYGTRLLLANSIQIGHVIRIENVGEGEDKKMGRWKMEGGYTGLHTLHPNHSPIQFYKYCYEIIALRSIYTHEY
jgi:hypothetical protein